MPKLRLLPKPFGEACHTFCNQAICQMSECIPEVVKAMRACVKKTGSFRLFSANFTAETT